MSLKSDSTMRLSAFNIFFFLSIKAAFTQIVYNVHLDNLLELQQGLGWPHSLKVAVGHEALMKLRRHSPGAQCTVTTPMGVTFNVHSPPNSRYEHWSDDCGLRVRNMVLADEGRWRLTYSDGESSVTGWIEVYIENDVTTYTAPAITLQDGDTHTNVVLTSLDNSYCMVAQPFSENSLIPGHCEVTLDHTTRAVQGNWNVLLGIPGKVEELRVQRLVNVNAERLDVGYVHDPNTGKLNLFCNIQHSSKNITFCRFQKTTSASGYNIRDGLGDGHRSYYGEGFDSRQCGMTIEQPTAQDYGTWRCSVGLQMWVGTQIVSQTPLQALISVATNSQTTRRSFKNEEIRTVFTQLDKEFSMQCHADVSLRYCWFQHPDGSQSTPLPLSDENQPFWYSGESLQVGDCGITFASATIEEAGRWTCHMGPNDQVGIELTDQFNVRVTGPLAANEEEVETSIGAAATLYCHTVNGIIPLDYCRFITPTRVGLSIDASVTEENAILNRYYFTPGRDLDYGDCSLTISSVQAEDLGVWTCAALADKDTVEARATITLYTTGSSSYSTWGLSQGGIAGLVIGLVVFFSALAGGVWFRRHKLFPGINRGGDSTVGFGQRTLSTSGSMASGNSS